MELMLLHSKDPMTLPILVWLAWTAQLDPARLGEYRCRQATLLATSVTQLTSLHRCTVGCGSSDKSPRNLRKNIQKYGES
jgi:hypothetical protein